MQYNNCGSSEKLLTTQVLVPIGQQFSHTPMIAFFSTFLKTASGSGKLFSVATTKIHDLSVWLLKDKKEDFL